MMRTHFEYDAAYRCVRLAYKFTGKERDAESGNDDFGARYYADTAGRWLSPDWATAAEAVPYATFDDPQSLNLYSFVGNNPLDREDADGHCNSATAENKSDKCEDAHRADTNSDEKNSNAQQAAGEQHSQAPSQPQIRSELSSLASSYGVPSAVVLAVAKTESNFNVNAVNNNVNKKGQVTSTDYGVMQVNSKNIGASAEGPNGKSFTITDSIQSNWVANANAGVAIVAQEYRAAIKAQPNGTAETRAQQIYSGYNAGPGGRTRYTQTGPNHGFADKRDYNFLMNYRLEAAQ